ncbi:hypothetical protein PtB15_15B302 [Puccinia triticina]|nr:hypothetical protein PtB15_15B302 [Puccinia triticina]
MSPAIRFFLSQLRSPQLLSIKVNVVIGQNAIKRGLLSIKVNVGIGQNAINDNIIPVVLIFKIVNPPCRVSDKYRKT